MNFSRVFLVFFGLALLLADPVFAQPGFGDDETSATQSSNKRPTMPTVEEAAAIEATQIGVHFPRLMAQIRLGLFSHQLNGIESGFQDVMDGLGVDGSPSLDKGSTLVGFTLRLQFSHRFGIWVDATTAGMKSNSVDSSYYFGVLGAYTVTSPTNRNQALIVGAGVGKSRMTVSTSDSFRYPIDDTYTLESISWRTDWAMVYPLMVTLESPNSQYNRISVFLSGLVLFGGTDKGEANVYGISGEDFNVPIEANLGGWSLTAGLVVGW